MFPPEKSHKVLNILGILAIVASFALTVSFNALAGAGKLASVNTYHSNHFNYQYRVGRPLRRDVLLSMFYMFHRPLGWYCNHCADKLVSGTSKSKHNNITRLRGCPRVYIISLFEVKVSKLSTFACREQRCFQQHNRGSLRQVSALIHAGGLHL